MKNGPIMCWGLMQQKRYKAEKKNKLPKKQGEKTPINALFKSPICNYYLCVYV